MVAVAAVTSETRVAQLCHPISFVVNEFHPIFVASDGEMSSRDTFGSDILEMYNRYHCPCQYGQVKQLRAADICHGDCRTPHSPLAYSFINKTVTNYNANHYDTAPAASSVHVDD